MIHYHSDDVMSTLFSTPWLVKICLRGFDLYELANGFQVLNVQNSALLKLSVRPVGSGAMGSVAEVDLEAEMFMVIS
jgi:hypothetical protein